MSEWLILWLYNRLPAHRQAILFVKLRKPTIDEALDALMRHDPNKN